MKIVGFRLDANALYSSPSGVIWQQPMSMAASAARKMALVIHWAGHPHEIDSPTRKEPSKHGICDMKYLSPQAVVLGNRVSVVGVSCAPLLASACTDLCAFSCLLSRSSRHNHVKETYCVHSFPR